MQSLRKIITFLCMNPSNLYRIYDALSFIYLLTKEDFTVLYKANHVFKVILKIYFNV